MFSFMILGFIEEGDLEDVICSVVVPRDFTSHILSYWSSLLFKWKEWRTANYIHRLNCRDTRHKDFFNRISRWLSYHFVEWIACRADPIQRRNEIYNILCRLPTPTTHFACDLSWGEKTKYYKAGLSIPN